MEAVSFLLNTLVPKPTVQKSREEGVLNMRSRAHKGREEEIERHGGHHAALLGRTDFSTGYRRKELTKRRPNTTQSPSS